MLLISFAVLAANVHSTAGAITAGGLGAVAAAFAGYIGRTFVRSQDSAASHLRAYFDQPLEFSRYLGAERLLAASGELTPEQRAKILSDLVQAIVKPVTKLEQNPDFLIDAAETHDAIVAAYAATDPLTWDSYAQRNLALHASEVGQLDHLLEDARFLLAADPARLVLHLDAARSGPGRAAAAVYRESAHYLAKLDLPMRASQLELTAHQLGYRSLAACIAEAAPDRPWQTHWSHTRQTTGHQVLTGHQGEVRAVAVGALADSTPVIISGGGFDHTVRVWRLADGAPVGEPLTGHRGGVNAVAVGALADGTPVIITGGSYDGTVRVWRLADGAALGEPLTGHRGGVNVVAVGALADGTPVIITGGGDDGTVRVWRLADGASLVPPLDLQERVRSVAVHANVIAVSAAGADIAVHQPALPRPNGVAAVRFPGTRPVGEQTG